MHYSIGINTKLFAGIIPIVPYDDENIYFVLEERAWLDCNDIIIHPIHIPLESMRIERDDEQLDYLSKEASSIL